MRRGSAESPSRPDPRANPAPNRPTPETTWANYKANLKALAESYQIGPPTVLGKAED